jgi:uncharacterized membrane protein (UPF0182 family)
MATRSARRTGTPLTGRLIAAAVFVVVILVALAGVIANFYTDILWFKDLGQEGVFWTRIWSEVLAGLLFGVISFAVIASNIIIARRMRPQITAGAFPEGIAMTPQQQIEEFFSRARGVVEPFVRWILFGISVVLAWSIGSSMAGDWEFFRLALAGVPFGIADPQFGLDVGFFVFRLPALMAINEWIVSTLAVTLVVTALVHLYDGGIRPSERLQGIDAHVKAHVSVLLGLIVASRAFDYWLSIYELDFSPRGQVLGASYTDVHAQIPAYWILIVIAIATGIMLMVNIRYRGWRLPLIALGIWVGASILVGAIVPALVQQLQVAPNELVQERPYIKRNIEFTRKAFDLESIDATGFPASSDLTAQSITDATATVSNIRLWDPNIVIDSYKQLQEIRFYYDFNDVDIDRYVIDGQLQQVLVSARELNVDQLSETSKTWVNKHLVYTHGYGAVVSPVNQVSVAGLPIFMVKDLPPKTTTDLAIKVPGVYYGEETKGYAIVDTKQKEFDYPVGEGNAETSYAAKNGIAVGSIPNRLAFTIVNGDIEILFSTAITSDSRMLFRRTIKERVGAIAPWLTLDGDPYPVITGGRIVWVLDGYTASSYYPYSQRYGAADVNYIRNSVKITVDAYDGTTTFYAFDDKDPVLATYRKIFPGMFTEGSKMPADIRKHLRYPEDLFKVQAEVYKTYHMLNPTVFYNKEDQWALPGELTADGAMAPFYVLMGLPGQQGQDFLLMEPFTPRNKDNMIGWMAVKSDPGSYGQRIVYNFPKQRLILGPEQISARLNQEPDISKELTLLNQQGSRALFGNLLVIPIKDSIVYVQPIYIQAEKSPMPELKRVVVAYADKIAMAPDLSGALLAVFGGAPPGSTNATGTPQPGPSAGSAGGTDMQKARDLYLKAIAAQKAGDWAGYGDYIKQLGDVLSRLSASSTPASGTASGK